MPPLSAIASACAVPSGGSLGGGGARGAGQPRGGQAPPQMERRDGRICQAAIHAWQMRNHPLLLKDVGHCNGRDHALAPPLLGSVGPLQEHPPACSAIVVWVGGSTVNAPMKILRCERARICPLPPKMELLEQGPWEGPAGGLGQPCPLPLPPDGAAFEPLPPPLMSRADCPIYGATPWSVGRGVGRCVNG